MTVCWQHDCDSHAVAQMAAGLVNVAWSWRLKQRWHVSGFRELPFPRLQAAEADAAMAGANVGK
jgi:hypothetical protein